MVVNTMSADVLISSPGRLIEQASRKAAGSGTGTS